MLFSLGERMADVALAGFAQNRHGHRCLFLCLKTYHSGKGADQIGVVHYQGIFQGVIPLFKFFQHLLLCFGLPVNQMLLKRIINCHLLLPSMIYKNL